MTPGTAPRYRSLVVSTKGQRPLEGASRSKVRWRRPRQRA
ncbi:hypothetical protein SLI_5861 [Streptomyces lividans 1326]|uniref:Uncharacterized protein n=1 Tax=Streptomyces lividans 1326 TaxID=1200984 RepID=A0A7U9DUW5_STRLI|nr:hypothetical protein SLI_5861 [Streptomyces lividans 1326]